MATFDQKNQTVRGNQFNADRIDLSDATFTGLPGDDPTTLLHRLDAVRAAVAQATERGVIAPSAGATIAEELRVAAASIARDDRAEASTRVRRATEALQVAAPVAAIGAALVTVWNALGGVS
ncbi:hypothetical protein [Micromonospora sp. DT227]|uniref:hypothetical protein n=1 Tax=Micromonospora sp. DT227 TaxID=3393433 RepID=UPI003CE6D1EE